MILALCHTVKATKRRHLGKVNEAFSDDDQKGIENLPLKNVEWEYQASSPDEKALVEACAAWVFSIFVLFNALRICYAAFNCVSHFTRVKIASCNASCNCNIWSILTGNFSSATELYSVERKKKKFVWTVKERKNISRDFKH